MTDTTTHDYNDDARDDHATPGGATTTGAATGATVGAVGGAIVGGPVGAAVGGAIGAAGGAAGGLGAERAMHADDDREGYDSRDDGPRAASTRTGMSDNATDTVRLHEEELRAEKRQVQAGEVAIRKEVHTEQRTMQVPVTREEVVIERRPVDRREAADAEFGAGEQRIRVPVHEEQVTVEKRPVVTEEITVDKRVTQDTQRFSDTVRREEAVINSHGDVAEVSDQAGVGHQHRWSADDRCECGERRI